MIILKDITELYKLGLTIGYFSVEDVINWTDYIIEVEEKPDYEIIDISLSKKKGINQIIEKLSQIECYLKSDLAPKILLGLVYIDFINNKEFLDYLKSFAKLLYKLSLHISDESVGEDIKYEILTAEDYLESALYYDASFTLENFVNKMEELLEPFLAYAVEYENSKYRIKKTSLNLEMTSHWYNFEDGKSIGNKGYENAL